MREASLKGLLIPTRQKIQIEDYQGAEVLKPMSGFYEDPVTVLNFASLYPTIIIAHNLCYTTYISNPNQYSTKFLTSSCTKTPAEHYFVKSNVKQGILPLILKEILHARANAKKLMKEEKDPFKKAVLNGRQLALKITANSVYGFTGAQVGTLPCVPISSSVTAYGRDMIKEVKNYVETHYSIKNGHSYDAKVLYGDTDSVMIKFGPKDLETCMSLGKEAAKLVTPLFPRPIELAWEKCYWPYLLLTKKKYVGLYWSQTEKYDMIDFKGMEGIRREVCKLVPQLLNQVLEAIFIRRDIQEATKLVKKTIENLFMNKIDMSLLVMRLGIGKNYKIIRQIVVVT